MKKKKKQRRKRNQVFLTPSMSERQVRCSPAFVYACHSHIFRSLPCVFFLLTPLPPPPTHTHVHTSRFTRRPSSTHIHTKKKGRADLKKKKKKRNGPTVELLLRASTDSCRGSLPELLPQREKAHSIHADASHLRWMHVHAHLHHSHWFTE